MKREEKNALSRQRILEAALEEFSCKGYDGASLNTVWTKKGISKGIIYHYFKDKDELYLLCVEACFDALTEYLKTVSVTLSGPARKQLQKYFDARLSFFSAHPLYLGIFADAVFRPPAQLLPEITVRRKAFDGRISLTNMKKGAISSSISCCMVCWVNTMNHNQSASKESLLSDVRPSKAITSLALPATLALLAKAVYNIVDTAYIGMLDSDEALAAVGVTLPLLLIMVSIENIFAALFNLPAQSLNCAARAESSVRISSVAVITGAAPNVLLDPVFMFSWGFDLGVQGASLATTISQCVTFVILLWFYLSGRSIIKIRPSSFRLSGKFLWSVTAIGIPTAVIQICLAAATSLTNIAAKPLPDSDLIIAAYGVVQRLILLFNRNPLVVGFGKWLLISQVAIYPAFGLCYMMTITFQTIGSSKIGLFLSLIRQGLFYIPFILILPKLLGVTGIYLSQPFADLFTIITCLFLVRPMKHMASENMNGRAQN